MLYDVEKGWIKDNPPVEHMALIDSSGKVIFYQAGEKDQIVFSRSQLHLFKGKILTHFHTARYITDLLASNTTTPKLDTHLLLINSNNISPNDILFMLEHEVKELRAVSSTHLYRIINRNKVKLFSPYLIMIEEIFSTMSWSEIELDGWWPLLKGLNIDYEKIPLTKTESGDIIAI